MKTRPRSRLFGNMLWTVILWSNWSTTLCRKANQAESIIKIISRPARFVKQSSSRLSSSNPANSSTADWQSAQGHCIRLTYQFESTLSSRTMSTTQLISLMRGAWLENLELLLFTHLLHRHKLIQLAHQNSQFYRCAFSNLTSFAVHTAEAKGLSGEKCTTRFWSNQILVVIQLRFFNRTILTLKGACTCSFSRRGFGNWRSLKDVKLPKGRY